MEFKKNQKIITDIGEGTLTVFTWLYRGKTHKNPQSKYDACFPAETHVHDNAGT
jgi:hypothetical protein